MVPQGALALRLTRRLLLALFAAVLVVTVVETVVRVGQLRAALLDDTRQDYVQFARGLRSVLADAWHEGGETEVRRLIEHADATAGTHIYMRLIDDAPFSVSDVDAPEQVFVEEGRMIVIEPLRLAEAPNMAIRVEQPLDTLEEIVQRSAQLSVVHAAAVLLASGVLMSLLGWLFVGRPVQALIAATRRIAQGQLDVPSNIRQDDELGELATELEAMAEQLKNARTQTEAEAGLKVKALDQLRHADRLRSVGQLASGLAHELGTPLNVISGRARLIEGADGITEELADDARVICDEAAKMTGLVEQLLRFARRQVPDRAEADVAGAAARVVHLLATLANKQGVDLALAATGGPCLIRGDALLVEQAIANVAVNGLQAMTDGGRLSVSVSHRSVARPGTTERVPSAVVTIIDDGPGIPDELRSRIFDPFFTTKDVGAGTGLGLSVVYGILEDHGGFVTVENEPGRGARFELVFPVQGKTNTIAPPAGASPAPKVLP